MDPLLVGILSSVIASTLMVFIEPRISSKQRRKAERKAEATSAQPLHTYQPYGQPSQSTQSAFSIPGWVSFALAIFLPPLAVYIEKGARKALWINIGLTLLWLWPGVFHALFIVLGKQLKPS